MYTYLGEALMDAVRSDDARLVAAPPRRGARVGPPTLLTLHPACLGELQKQGGRAPASTRFAAASGRRCRCATRAATGCGQIRTGTMHSASAACTSLPDEEGCAVRPAARSRVRMRLRARPERLSRRAGLARGGARAPRRRPQQGARPARAVLRCGRAIRGRCRAVARDVLRTKLRALPPHAQHRVGTVAARPARTGSPSLRACDVLFTCRADTPCTTRASPCWHLACHASQACEDGVTPLHLAAQARPSPPPLPPVLNGHVSSLLPY